jgi:hypothetical protein
VIVHKDDFVGRAGLSQEAVEHVVQEGRMSVARDNYREPSWSLIGKARQRATMDLVAEPLQPPLGNL